MTTLSSPCRRHIPSSGPLRVLVPLALPSTPLNSQTERGSPKSGQPGHLTQVFSVEPNVSEPPKAGAGLASHVTLEF